MLPGWHRQPDRRRRPSRAARGMARQLSLGRSHRQPADRVGRGTGDGPLVRNRHRQPEFLEPDSAGNIGGRHRPGTHTFYPSIAVDASGNVGIGFAASAPPYSRCLLHRRKASDRRPHAAFGRTPLPGLTTTFVSLAPPATAGRLQRHQRRPLRRCHVLGVQRVRADARTPISGEDGRWGTRFGRFSFAACEATSAATIMM